MILGSTLDMGVGPFLFFHTVNLVVQSLPLEYYTTRQYEKQSFWADRDWGNYPEPERHNPDRNIAPEREVPTHSRIEHER